MKLIMESWRQYVVENDVDDEERRMYDDLKISIVQKVYDDLEKIGREDIWDEEPYGEGVENHINELSYKNNNIPDLVKAIKAYFKNDQGKWYLDGLDGKILNELPPEVQNLMTLGEDGDANFGAVAAGEEAEAEEDEASGIMEKEDKDKDGAPAAPKWSKEPGKKAPKWADQDDNDPKVGDELEEENSFSAAAKKIEKKGTEGVFTAKAKKAGKSVQAYAKQVLAPGSKASTKTKRQAAFAKGAKTIADKK